MAIEFRKEYLGDSVYAEFDGFGTLTLTTNNGYPDDPRNRIVLDSTVYASLLNYRNAYIAFCGQVHRAQDAMPCKHPMCLELALQSGITECSDAEGDETDGEGN